MQSLQALIEAGLRQAETEHQVLVASLTGEDRTKEGKGWHRYYAKVLTGYLAPFVTSLQAMEPRPLAEVRKLEPVGAPMYGKHAMESLQAQVALTMGVADIARAFPLSEDAKAQATGYIWEGIAEPS